MRLCFVSQEYPPDTGHGGIATQTLRKAQALARNGADVHVVTYALDEASTRVDDTGVTVHRIPGPESRGQVRSEPYRWLAWSIEVARALDTLQAEFGFDAVEFPDYGAEGYVHALNRTTVADSKAAAPTLIVHAQGPLAMLAQTIGWPSPDDELFRVGLHMERVMVTLADIVYASSNCAASWIRSEYGVEAAAVLHTGVDLTVFRPRRAREHRPPLRVLYVGRVSSSKGVVDLVAAAAAVARTGRDICVRLVGRADAATQSELLLLAGSAGLELELPGPIEREGLPVEYRAADVFASPSLYEAGPGFTFLEAMASGLAVVGTRGSGIEETVGGEENGVLVAPGDRKALADALRWLADDVPARNRLGRLARERVETIADARRCEADIVSFYRELVTLRRVAA